MKRRIIARIGLVIVILWGINFILVQTSCIYYNINNNIPWYRTDLSSKYIYIAKYQQELQAHEVKYIPNSIVIRDTVLISSKPDTIIKKIPIIKQIEKPIIDSFYIKNVFIAKEGNKRKTIVTLGHINSKVITNLVLTLNQDTTKLKIGIK